MLVAILAVIGGSFSGLQAALNGRLGHLTGTVQAVLISIATSFAAILLITTLTRTWGALPRLATIPAVLFTGGLAGLAFVFTITWITPLLGVTATLVLTILGQLTMGLVLDHFGILRDAAVPVTPLRVVAILLVVVAAYLSRR
ncbi:MAG: DMT family transporter [Trueperaceae bacterium]|nr:DMT family transporter [Trueperaceae bacterium]MCW5818845.1 DMT family transporter [Trueperaceae bacterium]